MTGKFKVSWQVARGSFKKREGLTHLQAQLVARNVPAARLEGAGLWEEWFAGVLARYGRQY